MCLTPLPSRSRYLPLHSCLTLALALSFAPCAHSQDIPDVTNQPPNIIDFLGLPKLLNATKSCTKTLGQMPLTQFISNGMAKPVLQSMGLMSTPGVNSLVGAPPPTPAPAPFAPGAPNPAASGPGAGTPPASGDAPATASPPPAAAAAPEADAAPPPQPPAELTAQIAAASDPATEATKIEALRFLARQDCACYPETIDTILAALDDCSEAVRYAALRALWHSQNTAVCVICRQRHRGAVAYYSCPCEIKTITRVSQLLLDRDHYSRLREGSPRVRNLARIILTECITGRSPVQNTNPPVPDPALPDHDAHR